MGLFSIFKRNKTDAGVVAKVEASVPAKAAGAQLAGRPDTPLRDIVNVINVGMTVRGEVIVDRGISIGGCVEGNVRHALKDGDSPSRIVVGLDGVVNGDIYGILVMIQGKVNGNIHCESVVVAETAKVNGDINYSRKMQVHDGACINGMMTNTSAQRLDNQKLGEVKPFPPSADISDLSARLSAAG